MRDEEPTDAVRVALSALMDGDHAAADHACRAWRSDASARDDWHTYHLIGDLLRSDEHRCEPAHDANFVARLRERLAAEPTVLAPQPVAGVAFQRARRLRTWMAPAAVAAGFVAVAGALVITRVASPEGEAADRLAGVVVAPVAPVVQASTTPGAGSAPAGSLTVAEGATVIRNSELDRYLAAHRQHANTFAPPAPRGDLRNVSVAEPGR
jgi:sigma-E factor negative regulatory protein RseA